VSEQKIRPEVVKAFLGKVAAIHTFRNDEDGIKEHSLCINLQGIVDFYTAQIGSEPFIQTWDELRVCLMLALEQAKRSKPGDYELVVRLTGKCGTWLAIKVYSVFVYTCDRIFYAGDTLIRL
jgi:hypothetical protein